MTTMGKSDAFYLILIIKGDTNISNGSFKLEWINSVVVVTLFSNIIHEQNTSNTNLTNKAYPGYWKHVLC